MKLKTFTFQSRHLARLLTALVVGMATAAIAHLAMAQTEPSRAPVLRIETGMHTAVINRIGVDREGKFLVTTSDDKTVY